MTPELILIAGIAWVVTGVIALILDWTRDLDLTLGALIGVLLCGAFLGPAAWLIWLIRIDFGRRNPIVIMRSRRTRS